jgi:hypothetical protein
MCRKLHVISHLFIALNNDVFLELHPFFLIKDQHTRCTLLHDRCRNGLYPIPSLELPSGKMCLSAIKPSSEQWNVRFGHPSFKVVSRVLHTHNLSFVSNKNEAHVCDACQWAKSHKLPFPKSISVSKVPLELMFSDVRGPTPTSVSKNNYYVSFIDDFSKFALVYLLKHKSDVFQRFQEFQAHVERLFDRKVLAMQTDWSGECQKLSPFFDHVGISHLVSCPHTHQQNGSVECKHRHIVKVGLVLLAHASMPLKFWDEPFLTAVFLNNRLPTPVLAHVSPIEKLFDTKLAYSFLRTFGCTCWPNLQLYNTNKHAFCSKQCAFLGYNTHHKGYMCLDISSDCVYISRDVVFDENVFPFAKLHVNAGARLHSEISLLPPSLLDSTSFGGRTVDTNHLPKSTDTFV